ncbi:MAG: hypothetical protein Kow0074_15040 [Candidatus Zixiibacteriota bacterium]
MSSRLRRFTEPLPGLVAALLPSVACPACWPAYAGLLSAVGLGTFLNGPYFLAIVTALLAVTLVGLGYRARSRRGYGPLILGAIASVVIVALKITNGPSYGMYVAGATLIGASLWNNWPHRRASAAPAANSCGCAGGCQSGEQSQRRGSTS